MTGEVRRGRRPGTVEAGCAAGGGVTGPLKVLHVITGLYRGGAETALFRLVTHDRTNAHVVVSLSDEGHYGPRLRAAGVPVRCLGLPGGGLSRAHLARAFGVPELRRIVREHAPDVVQTWLYHADLIGGLAARAGGAGVLCWNIRLNSVHRGGYGRAIRVVSRLAALLSRVLPDYVISCAHSAATSHVGIGYPEKRVVVIPNGYDLERFRPRPAAAAILRERLDCPPDVALIGLLGRWNAVKGHALLLDALRQLEPSRGAWLCVLGGIGVDRDNAELEREIERCGLGARVRALGPSDEPETLLAGLDLHVLASLDEGFPNVVAEALACGVPSAVTDVGDAARIVGSTGWVVPPNDPKALTEAIALALAARRQERSWAARRASCRERAESLFGIETMVSSYDRLWRRAVRERRG